MVSRLLSEDTEYPSVFEIQRCEELDIRGQRWDKLILTIKQGATTLTLGGPGKDPDDSVVLCRDPQDEPKTLAANLQKILDGTVDEIGFEPSEPSFEILVKRSGEPTKGFRVQIWFDSGNVETGIYRWDSLGMRFFTTKPRLERFIDELKDDFAW